MVQLKPTGLLHCLTVLALWKVKLGGANKESLCQGKPADVVFLLDSSGSILAPDFQRQLTFVSDVIDLFDMTHDVMTQVGVVSFSNWAFQEFGLDSYRSVDSMKRAVRGIRQIHGDTNTAAALAHLQDVSFKKGGGARAGIPHIGIVLTDGRSNVPAETAREAHRAKKHGIHLFAVGVGDDVDHKELRALASEPAVQNVFTVDSYSALKHIKEMLAIETCKVTDPTVTPTTPTTTEQLQVDQACGDATLADIVFSTSPTSGPKGTEKALKFYKNIVNELPLANGNIHIGMVPRHCHDLPEIQISDNMDKTMVLNQLHQIENSGPQLADVVKYMRRISFNEKQGARPDAKRMAVIMVDSKDPDLTKTLREAGKMTIMKNVEVFVIGIGKEVAPSDLNMLATAPSEQHVFHVEDYDQLSPIVDKLAHALCPVPSA